jgi:hypothetical protein
MHPRMLRSSLEEGKYLSSHSGIFIFHSIGGWVGPSVVLDTKKKRKNSCPCRELNPGYSVIHPTD